MHELTKEEFLEKYELKDRYKEEFISWDVLHGIFGDYAASQKQETLEEIKDDLIALLRGELQEKIHSIEGRVKKPEHLVEKIIRKICIEDNYKYADISKENYTDVVRDLIGIRILVLSKEDWEAVHDVLCGLFKEDAKSEKSMAEAPKAYVRYGDRDIFRKKIDTAYTNKGYRSQHYIVKYQEHFCEIQVRTIAEEVFGEFDHRVRYPYRSENRFLRRYTNTISQTTAMIDELISTCMQMQGKLWDECEVVFENDCYVDWSARSKEIASDEEKVKVREKLPENAKSLANKKILRKEGI